MIKPNRRVPGTINSISTTHKNKPSFTHNDTLPIDSSSLPCKQPRFYENTVPHKQPLYERQQNHAQMHPIQVDLSHKGIADLQDSLDAGLQLALISVLNISNNNLVTIPAPIFNKLSSLSKLYLAHNRIDKISFPYFRENRLRIIDISNNCLKSLNLEHLQSIVKVNCSQNELSFLTLPPSVSILNCRGNQLSNIYFLQNCHLLEEADLSGNQLYDLKFNFKPYLKFKEERTGVPRKAYEALKRLDCGQNKIQFIEGMDLLPNLRQLSIRDNELCLTRQTINQLFLLQSLQSLQIQGNPLQGSGLTYPQIISLVLSRMPSLLYLNDQPVSQMNEEEGWQSARKSQFSGINEEPYQLFMESERKGSTLIKPIGNAEWNFTLGDCDNEEQEHEHSKIHELSEIQFVNPSEPNERLEKKDLEETYHLGLLQRRNKEIPLKITRSSHRMSHHIHYRSFLTSLLPMSYIPASPIPHGADITSGRRLDPNDDEFILISHMLQGRGGVIYVKKVNRWCVMESGREVFPKYGESSVSSMGFLLNDLSEAQFREHCRLNKLLKRGNQDITGLQPNAFSYFHLLVRIPQTTPQVQPHYPCLYLIESSQL